VTANPTAEAGPVPAPGPPPAKNMEWVPGGEIQMGSNDFYPEEGPVRRVAVDGFWMDEHPVTVAEFRRFVKATGHVTVAERPLDPEEYPDADPDLLVPGSLVFHMTRGPVNLWRPPELVVLTFRLRRRYFFSPRYSRPPR
jgi:formylglycine-generating enzyme